MTNGSKKKSQGNSENTFKMNENNNRTYQNLWDAAKVLLREKYIAINAQLKKKRKSWQISYLVRDALTYKDFF